MNEPAKKSRAEVRVVVSGLGVVCPLGVGIEPFWAALTRGESHISDARTVFGLDLKTTKCCLVTDDNFNARAAAAWSQGGISRGGFLALETTTMALADAGIDPHGVEPGRLGLALGSTLANALEIEAWVERRAGGNGSIPHSPTDPRACTPGAMYLPAVRQHHISGPVQLIPAACAASNYAIGYAYDAIRTGRADIMVAGGAEPFSKTLQIGFSRLNLVAPTYCQPFDRQRKGLLVSEGAGILVLESYERARRRGAHIYCEVLGCGSSCDAHHVTAPSPDGRGAVLALSRALRSARVNVDQVDYISAHGTGTPTNDLAESRAIVEMLGDAAKRTPVSSIKSMLGHTMGAAGAIEAIAGALSLQHKVVPPTINHHEADPQISLDCVPNTARELPLSLLVSNSYGFLGHNASLTLAAA